MIVTAKEKILNQFKIVKASFFGNTCFVCSGDITKEKLIKYNDGQYNFYFCLRCAPDHNKLCAIKYLLQNTNYSWRFDRWRDVFSELFSHKPPSCNKCKLPIQSDSYVINKHKYDKDCFVSIAGEEFL